MRFVRIGFVAVLAGGLFGIGCCCGGGSFDAKNEKAAACTHAPNSGEVTVAGRILRDKAKKHFPTGWGFRAGEKESPTYYLLKVYPEEFDQPFNAPFMNERRAKLQLKLCGKGSGTLTDPIHAEILDIPDISRRMDGN